MNFRNISKINIKKFLLMSLVPTGATFFVAKSQADVIALITAYVGTVVYLFMFAEAVYELVEGRRRLDSVTDKNKVTMLFILKFGILAGTMVFAAQILDERVIVPLLNYVLHIFILIFSLKKQE